MKPEKALAGKTAIVTGGGGSIGTGISVRLAQDGANIVVAQRSDESASEVVDRIEDLDGDAVFLRTDMSSEADIESVVDETIEEFGSTDIVVNNAANPKKEWAQQMDRDLWEDVIATNLTGPYRLAQKAYHQMDKDGYGRVINIGAIQSLSPLPGAVAYASSKSGLEGLTRSLATEWSSPSVTINAIRVGPVYGRDWVQNSSRNREAPVEDEFETVPSEVDAEAATLIGRIGRPSDVAALVSFLSRPESGFITGATIPCDGGRCISRDSEPFDQVADLS